MGHIFAHVTCTRVRWPGEGDADYDPNGCGIEEHGWIDRRWSPYVLHESRNDATPVVDVNEDDTETLRDEVHDALGWLEGGYEDNLDGTFYASSSYQPYASNSDDRGDWSYSYAIHFTRKFYGSDGWTEERWHPRRDGGIEDI